MQNSTNESDKSKRKESARDRNMRGRASFQPDTRPNYPSIEIKPQSAEPPKMWAEAAQVKSPADKSESLWPQPKSDTLTKEKPRENEVQKPEPLAMPTEQERRVVEAQAHAELPKPEDLEDKKDEDEKKDSKEEPRRPREGVRVEPPAETEPRPAAESPEQPTGTHESAELTETEKESFKQIARELQEQNVGAEAPRSAEDEYLEQVAQTGNPQEAEAHVIADHDLSETQNKADEALEALTHIEEFEELLKEAADKVGDQELSDEQLTDLAEELVPVSDEEEDAEQAPGQPSNTQASALSSPNQTNLPPLTNPNIPTTPAAQNTVPAPPVPTPGGGTLPPPPPPGGGGGGGGGPNQVPTPGMPPGPDNLSRLANLSPNESAMSRAERARMRRRILLTALLAGLLGYYIGKHRGKNQKEAELKPQIEEQAKVNKEQSAQLLAGERRIGSLERMKKRQEKELYESQRREQFAQAKAEPLADKPAQAPAEALTPAVAAAAAVNTERDQSTTVAEETPPVPPPSAEQSEELAGETPAPEAVVPPQTGQTGKETAPNQVLEAPATFPATEQSKPSAPELAPAAPVEQAISPRESLGGFAQPTPAEALAPAAIATLALPELLSTARDITIDGQSAEQAYQSHEIDESGLRRVVAEYARGGSPERVLAQERRVMELRRASSPEYLHRSAIGGASAAGGDGGVVTQAASSNIEQRPDHLLPANDQEEYPSSAPQHLLPAYDQETVTKKRHRMIAAGAALIGAGTGIILALLLL